jgi:drug/metabolite transporter (DMT)-like permease
VAGAIGVCGLGLFYLAMARGQIAIAAPVTGVLAVLVPVIFTAVLVGLPPTQQIVGFALAILGIYLLSRPAEGGGGHGGLGLAIFSGLFFGLYYILIDKSGEHATYWPLMVARIGAAAVVGGFLIATKPSWDGVSGVMGTASISGVLDAFGGFFFLSASQYGRLDVAAVLSSLYPVVTTLLAIFFLKERLTITHWSGLLAAGVAIALVTFPPIF